MSVAQLCHIYSNAIKFIGGFRNSNRWNSLQWNSRYSTEKLSGDMMNIVLINLYAFCVTDVKFFEIFTYLTCK